MAEYLRYKDCAKILYNLYQDCFNRYVEIAVPMEVEENERKKFFLLCSNGRISDEEIWAYSKKVMELSTYDSETFTYTNIQDLKREWKVEKREFLSVIFSPVCRFFLNKKQVYTKKEVIEFILAKNLGEGIFENKGYLREWLRQSKYIEIDDAEKLASNIKKFFENL